MNKASINVFDQLANTYDSWFDRHRTAFLSEIEAFKKVMPTLGDGLEVGAGSGRFSAALGIKWGVEPSDQLGHMAKSRGVKIFRRKCFLSPRHEHHSS